ncbi:ATP-binding cassette domain-containing protein, partial [Lacticaseibacillus rhamnosus]
MSEGEGLTKRFGPFTAVAHVSVSIVRGSIFGFPGPNGSGKSTVIRMLCGILEPTEGTAKIAGHDGAVGGQDFGIGRSFPERKVPDGGRNGRGRLASVLRREARAGARRVQGRELRRGEGAHRADLRLPG